MTKKHKLTTNTGETDIASLLDGEIIFSIPYFQRSYKWNSKRLEEFNADVLNLVDGATDLHFLGAIIINSKKTNPSEPSEYAVIDGQQRITTLFIYLAAIVKTLYQDRKYSEASGLFLKYLVINRKTKLISNIKLFSCKEDRKQINYVYNDVLSEEKFTDKLGLFELEPLPPSGKDNGHLRNNYRSTLRFLKEQIDQEGIKRIRAIYRKILEAMTIVQIDVWDPTNGPKIFDCLNSRQEPMTIGDLVRNEVFSRVAHKKPAEIEKVDQLCWQPFYERFTVGGRNLFDSYFFPYGLILNSNLKKSDVYGSLRKKWQSVRKPKVIIEQLSEYQTAFIDIVNGTNEQKHKLAIASQFQNLHALNAPSSTYPFLMQLSNNLKEGNIKQADGIATLDVIESFLIRRAVCGHEPTGLHAVFKKLWGDCSGKPNQTSVIKAIKKHKTVVWPTSKEFADAIETRPLYGVGVTKYLILQYDIKLGGDHPDNTCWIEHVLPVKPDKTWFLIFTKSEHKAIKDRLANLIPLTKKMNISLGNKPYKDKRTKYKMDSSFKSAREFARKYNAWTPANLEKRGKELARWAKTRWKH